MTQKGLDLFCGIGGLTLGLERAGVDVIAGVDDDETAIETYDENFDYRGVQCDLAETSPFQFDAEYDIAPHDVDVIGGGPPCQGYSTANLQRDEDDPRNNFVFVFSEYVRYYCPDYFVMENVTGIESIDDGRTVDLLYEVFEEAGYDVDHTTLNAADYGVPQKRERVFFVGVCDDTQRSPSFPDPTHVPQDVCVACGERGDWPDGGRNRCPDCFSERVSAETDVAYSDGGAEREPYVGLSDVVDTVDSDDWQTSPGGQTHQVRGEWGMRRCSEPTYTITGTQYPTVIDGDFEPDPRLSGVGDVGCSRTMTREEVRAAQTLLDVEVETDSKTKALTYVGNAVPPKLAESVVGEIVRSRNT